MAADANMSADTHGTAVGRPLLLQFARAPDEGRVKTRMMPHLSAAGACDLHCELTLWTCRQLLESRLGDVELSVAGDSRHPLFRRCEDLGVSRISQQQGADLGQKMYNALCGGLKRYSSVILVGSDCPGIDLSYLALAVAALREASIVLGPATDGGYVLIGARIVKEEIFKGIPWGGDQVYARTQRALLRAGLTWAALPVLTDIDRPEDLPIWEAMRRVAADHARTR